MKLLKIIILLVFSLSLGYAQEAKKTLAIPYNFMVEDEQELTYAKFLAYAYNDESLAKKLLAPLLEAGKDDAKLAKVLSEEKDIGIAKKILSGLGDLSSLKPSYLIDASDDGDVVVLLPDTFMLFNKEGKWQASKISPLYTYLAKNAGEAELWKKNPKTKAKIELIGMDLTFLELENSKSLTLYTPFNVYLDAYEAFHEKNFRNFTLCLDDNSRCKFFANISEEAEADEIIAELGKKLDYVREYKSIANLGTSYVVFFYEDKGDGKGKALRFEFFRDMGCIVEIMNYDGELEEVMLDFITM